MEILILKFDLSTYLLITKSYTIIIKRINTYYDLQFEYSTSHGLIKYINVNKRFKHNLQVL